MTPATTDGSLPVSVIMALYLRTKTLHVEAERTGIIRDLLRGSASRDGYILLLRNLLPAYQALEQGLASHNTSPGIGALAHYRLERAPAIESDLVALCGESWHHEIALLPAAENYARRITEVARGNGERLIAHAYTRYLGDLNGGLILQRLLARTLELRPAELSFMIFRNTRIWRRSRLRTVNRSSEPARSVTIRTSWSRKAPSPSRSISICPAPFRQRFNPPPTPRNRASSTFSARFGPMYATSARSDVPAPRRYVESNCGHFPASRQCARFRPHR